MNGLDMKTLLIGSGSSSIWEQQLVLDERKFIKQFMQRNKGIHFYTE